MPLRGRMGSFRRRLRVTSYGLRVTSCGWITRQLRQPATRRWPYPPTRGPQLASPQLAAPNSPAPNSQPAARQPPTRQPATSNSRLLPSLWPVLGEPAYRAGPAPVVVEPPPDESAVRAGAAGHAKVAELGGSTLRAWPIM